MSMRTILPATLLVLSLILACSMGGAQDDREPLGQGEHWPEESEVVSLGYWHEVDRKLSEEEEIVKARRRELSRSFNKIAAQAADRFKVRFVAYDFARKRWVEIAPVATRAQGERGVAPVRS